ncbi:hypothetical protein R6Z07F_020476 [Ovis aries]
MMVSFEESGAGRGSGCRAGLDRGRAAVGSGQCGVSRGGLQLSPARNECAGAGGEPGEGGGERAEPGLRLRPRGCGAPAPPASPSARRERQGLDGVAGPVADSNPGQLYGWLRCWNRRRSIPVGDNTVPLFWDDRGIKLLFPALSPSEVLQQWRCEELCNQL